jgi:hypothetical protein
MATVQVTFNSEPIAAKISPLEVYVARMISSSGNH